MEIRFVNEYTRNTKANQKLFAIFFIFFHLSNFPFQFVFLHRTCNELARRQNFIFYRYIEWTSVHLVLVCCCCCALYSLKTFLLGSNNWLKPGLFLRFLFTVWLFSWSTSFSSSFASDVCCCPLYRVWQTNVSCGVRRASNSAALRWRSESWAKVQLWPNRQRPFR